MSNPAVNSMTNPVIETVAPTAGTADPTRASDAVTASLKRRYAAEKRFRAYGVAAIGIAITALVMLFVNIIGTGLPAFRQTMIHLPVTLDAAVIDPSGERDPEVLSRANYRGVIAEAAFKLFPDVTERAERRKLLALISPGASFAIREQVMENPDLIGERVEMLVPVADDFDQLSKGHISGDVAEAERRVSDQQIRWFEDLKERGSIETTFNWRFFTAGDSRSPELAGIRGALAGSFWTMLVTLVLSFPLGIGAAVYLEEFAPKNRWTDLIEVNINNLAAVPSIVFGLLGLAMFLGYFGLPRSAPLVGGMVLALITLPTIIIASRAALKAVPPSIREAALGIGASKVQMVFHHVVPLAMPGMMTGAIIGMAHALGETAPLLMIGMVAFIVDIPSGPLDPATVMPVQIFLWSDLPERAFVERASAAIMVLLSFLIAMNILAVILRKRFENKW
jgi:phosphate transport system permease protein